MPITANIAYGGVDIGTTFAPLASPTFTGTVIIGKLSVPSSGSIYLTANGATGIYFMDTSSNQYGRIFANTSGAFIDSTTSLSIRTYTSAGTGLSTRMTVNSSGIDMQGTVTVPAPTNDNSTQVATTAFVKASIPSTASFVTSTSLAGYSTTTATAAAITAAFQFDKGIFETDVPLSGGKQYGCNPGLWIYWGEQNASAVYGFVSVSDAGICNHTALTTNGTIGAVTTINGNGMGYIYIGQGFSGSLRTGCAKIFAAPKL